MGLILHRSKLTEDAAVVLGAATDHDPQCSLNHFVMGNMLAVLGDFNNSVKHFDMCLKIEPTFELAYKHKFASLCHSFLLQNLQTIRQ